MSSHENRAVARRASELWAGDSTVQPEEILAPDYANHQEPDATGGVSTMDLATYKRLLATNHRAFPDLRVEILTQIADGDLVATRWRFSATHLGEYEGLAPTGNHAVWTGIQMDRVTDGKIVESWVDWDKYRLFKQLGLID